MFYLYLMCFEHVVNVLRHDLTNVLQHFLFHVKSRLNVRASDSFRPVVVQSAIKGRLHV